MVLGQALITWREGLEAALITSIILAYLSRTGRMHLSRYVWYGVYASLGLSVALGVGVWAFYGVLSETVKLLFEGVAAWLAVIVLSSMVIWMATKGREIKHEIERRVAEAIKGEEVGGRLIVQSRKAILSISALSFVIVFREGLETVLFLTPFMLREMEATLTGAGFGLILALLISYGFFVMGMRLNLRRFFYFSSILLVLIAGGLAGYGTHELIEYGEEIGVEMGWLAEKAYTLPISEDNPLHHNNFIGSILAVMIGYTASAEWLRIIVQISYLAIALPLVIRAYRR